MNRADIISRLRASEPALRARGVEALYLYGSYARDEARSDSDIDILVDLDPERTAGLQGYMAPYLYLEVQFPGMDIGYGTRDEIVSYYKPSIDQGTIRIF